MVKCVTQQIQIGDELTKNIKTSQNLYDKILRIPKVMIYSLLADLILILHFCFILFVIFGGVLLIRWNWIWKIHLPAVIWGVLIQYLQWSCPLTHLESYLRINSGESGYETGFIEYFVTALVYPEITPQMHLVAGFLLILINLAIYLYIFKIRTKQNI